MTKVSTALKQKHCDFTFALSDLDQCQEVIAALPDFDVWAYIKHVPDDENGSDHYHFFIHLKQPSTIATLSDKLTIPPNMIEWVRVKTRMIQYLIHKNNPEKHQYSEDQIITNNREFIHKFIDPVANCSDIFKEYNSLSDVATGKITPHHYLELHSDSISSLPFYSRSIFLMRLFNLGKEGSEKYMSRL